ncbi:hypothetical protein IWW50_001912 [Coemansia erecta]|nr:hypothetical protein IWW50_001912 [Coemansia erecta]
MRKSTSLKLGLNVRKPVTGSSTTSNNSNSRSSSIKNASPPKSVFTENEEPDAAAAAPQTIAHMYAGGSAARESAKLAHELQSADPSIYAYDDVYDKISDARSRIKKPNTSTDLKPRYMDKLLETAQQRKLQGEVARERLLDKEREREGDMYADKETFVTESYREHKELRRKMVAEEEAKEQMDESNNKGKKKRGLDSGFYRGLLDQMDREDVSKAVETATPTDDTKTAEAEPDTPVVLSSGLNVVSSSANRRPRDQPTSQEQHLIGSPHQGQVQDSRRDVYHRNSRSNNTRSVQAEMNELEQMKLAQHELEQQNLVQRYARRNKQADIDAARQRYLDRKQRVQ